jgi:hypothetical protein
MKLQANRFDHAAALTFSRAWSSLMGSRMLEDIPEFGRSMEGGSPWSFLPKMSVEKSSIKKERPLAFYAGVSVKDARFA